MAKRDQELAEMEEAAKEAQNVEVPVIGEEETETEE